MTGTTALTTTQRESAPTFVAAETHRLEPITIQSASIADAERLYDLITNQLAQGHLLPRELPELKAHATRFFVATADNVIVGCGDLAPLSPTVAEIRSLVVEVSHRGMGVGTSLIKVIIMQAHERHFSHLTCVRSPMSQHHLCRWDFRSCRISGCRKRSRATVSRVTVFGAVNNERCG